MLLPNFWDSKKDSEATISQLNDLKNKIEKTKNLKNKIESNLEFLDSIKTDMDLEIKKLVQLKQNNNPNYEVELANTIRKLSTLTNKIPNIRAQIESDINYELNKQNQIKSSQPFKQEQQTKDEIISKIINNMNMAGEFSFGDISISERIDIMQNVKNKLNSKSMEELQILLSSYQYNQEQTQKHATRR